MSKYTRLTTTGEVNFFGAPVTGEAQYTPFWISVWVAEDDKTEIAALKVMLQHKMTMAQ